MLYPTGFLKWLMKFPLSLYRTGLGGVLGLFSIMALTTRGRRSGEARFTALECRRHGSKFYVIAAWGERSQWYQNLREHPAATVKLGRQIYNVSASFVDDKSEALRVIYLFRQASRAYYDQMLVRFSSANKVDLYTLPDIAHEIKVVRLDIVNQPLVLPPVPADRTWVWAVLLAVLIVPRVLFRSRQQESRLNE